MKLGIMQPYFFPYLGYYSLIKNTDKWIIFDSIQYIKKGWINRNRILKPKQGWQYIVIPIKKQPRETMIKDTFIDQSANLNNLIRGKLTVYKNIAPYYQDVLELVNKILENEFTKILELNEFILKMTCEYLDIEFKYKIYSEMGLDINKVNGPGDWALNISKALNATTYINPPGGKEIFDKTRFKEANIELKFLNINLIPYNQRRSIFEPSLSIIDVMMFNSKEEINSYFNNYTLT